MEKKADQEIRAHFRSRSRKIKKDRDANYLVPLRYDPITKDVLTFEKFDARKHYKKLKQEDWEFLQAWQKNGYDSIKTQDELNLTDFDLTRLVKKLEPFKQEEAMDRALATIPSTAFIQARHVENVLGAEPLDDSKRDSLKELSKIIGAYKPTTNLNLNVNAFVKPQLSPEQEKATREFFDTIATEVSNVA